MKKYILTTLLALGLLGTSGLFARQQRDVPLADRKERKMEKKESKINRKMFHDRGWAAARKENKAHKKEYKRRMLQEMGQHDTR